MRIIQLSMIILLALNANQTQCQKHRYKKTNFVRSDSVFIDVIHLWGHDSQRPTIKGSKNEDGTIITHHTPELAFQYELNREILEVEIRSTTFIDRCGFCRNRYKSRFTIEMDDRGNIVNIADRGSTVKSISSKQFHSIIRNFDWVPAKYENEAVNCMFDLKVTFHESICAWERSMIWQKFKDESLANYNDKILCVYNEGDAMWDSDFRKLILAVESAEKLDSVIDVYSENYYSKIEELMQDYIKIIESDTSINCQKYENLSSVFERELSTFLHDEVIFQLKNASKN